MTSRTAQTVASPQWADAAKTMISAQVTFAELASMGPIPFVAKADDVEAHGVTLFNQLVAGVYGEIAAYVAPVPTAAQLVRYVSTAQQASLAAGKTVNVAASGAAAVNVLCDGLSTTRADLGLMVENARADASSTVNWLDNNGVVTALAAAEVIQLADLITSWVNATYGAAGNAIAGIKASPPSITTYAQIDSAFAALASS